MNKEELIQVLRQFDEKRVEELPEKTRNMFYAIMKIADERDELENIRKEAIEWVEHNQYYFPRPNDLLNILNKGSDKDV